MVYNNQLVGRIAKILQGHPGIAETKMFGGIGYLMQGNMACGVNKDDLIVRVGPDQYEAALSEPHTAVFDLTGRPMTGWIVVKPDGYQAEPNLRMWVMRGIKYAGSLPAK